MSSIRDPIGGPKSPVPTPDDADRKVLPEPDRSVAAPSQSIGERLAGLDQSLKDVAWETLLRGSNVGDTIAHHLLKKDVDLVVKGRDYPVLDPNQALRTAQGKLLRIGGRPATAAEVVQTFRPDFLSASYQRVRFEDEYPQRMLAEVLPPTQGSSVYSVIYYVMTPDEDHPDFDELYDAMRPVLWGSKNDWEAVRVDVDGNTGEPVGLGFESTDALDVYHQRDARRIHLHTEVKRDDDGEWVSRMKMPDGTLRERRVHNPFGEDIRPKLTYVTWNGMMALRDDLQARGTQHYQLDDPKPEMLTDEQYGRLDLFLRTAWLRDRKRGQ